MEKNRLKVFWDLDGTLVDSRLRLYKLFSHLTGQNELTFEEYWDCKYAGLRQQEMLDKVGYAPNRAADFRRNWLTKIEQSEWLKHDTLQEGARETLHFFTELGAKQYLITNRQSISAAVEELRRLGIEEYFDEFYTTALRSKKNEIIQANLNVNKGDILIGDSDEDIIAAKELGVYSIAVCTDIRLRQRLENCKPDRIVMGVGEISHLIW